MGGTVSSAKENLAEEGQRVDAHMRELELKKEAMMVEIASKRGIFGAPLDGQNKEVVGGRSIMRYQKMYFQSAKGVPPKIQDAIGDFFAAADGGIDGDDTGAQHSAVHGCAKLVDAALDTLVGSTSSETSEEIGFHVLWMNNSFCRVDYYFYQQHICAAGVGEGSIAGFIPTKIETTARIVVCDIAVLGPDQIQPTEMNFLFTRALAVKPADFGTLLKISATYMGLLMVETLMNSVRMRAAEVGLEKKDIQQFQELTEVATAQGQAIHKLVADLDPPDSNFRSNETLEKHQKAIAKKSGLDKDSDKEKVKDSDEEKVKDGVV